MKIEGENMKNKKTIIPTIIIITTILIIGGVLIISSNKKEKIMPPSPQVDPNIYSDTDFNLRLLKTVNSSQTGNYLISPYSIEIALNMVREGSSGITREELDKILPTRNIPNIAIKNRIGNANAIFMKDKYKQYIESLFRETLEKEYHAEVILDSFTTPQKINEWVNEKTKGMINKIMDDISPDFVLGLSNAISIDVEWNSPFECINTTEEKFEKMNHEKIKVEMMHQTYESNVNYFETDKAKGVMIPYRKYDDKGKEVYGEDGNQLEFVGILPKDDINKYINDLTEEELQKINTNIKTTDHSLHLNLSLPRFHYEFELEKFKKVLIAMGIKTPFDKVEADFSKIITKENLKKMDAENLYINSAIHKTYIDLNEQGTKAAAVTFFGFDKANAIMEEPKIINLEFNKSFIYMIRDKKTKEVLFFGVVDQPNQWNGSTCKEKDS